MKNNFFKTEAFKCIIVLVLITVFMCGLLAVLNDVLSVSREERLNRAVEKIYGESVAAEELEIDSSRGETTMGKIDERYGFDDDGKHFELYKSTGYNGYKNGTVTMWVLIEFDGDSAVKVNNVQLDSYSKQTLMSAFGEEFYKNYTKLTTEELQSGKLFRTGKTSIDDAGLTEFTSVINVVTNATKSSNAMNNAVNTVLLYVWGDAV